jgi:hypothetical protein
MNPCAVIFQAQRVPGVWGIQISRQSAHGGGKVASIMHKPPLPPGNILGTHFLWRLRRPQGPSAAEMNKTMKNPSDSIGNLTRGLPECTTVPKPTASQRAPVNVLELEYLLQNGLGVCSRYVLNGPSIESLWGRNIPYIWRQTLGPTQPPVPRVLCLLLRVKWVWCGADHPPPPL